MTNFQPAKFALGVTVSEEIANKGTTFKAWGGGWIWRFIPRKLWGFLGRPYELISLQAACDRASERINEELYRFGMDLHRGR